jgi:DNA-binding response OmpR family regulator
MTFTEVIPALKDSHGVMDLAKVARRAPFLLGSPMSLRILVVDDDLRLYGLLSSYLSENNVVTTHARDGLSALNMLPSGSFDAVILDVMMPGLDGLSVLRKIRETSGVPVLMLTAKGDETDRVVGLELGADDYMAKPFSPRELLARVKAVLRRGKPTEEGRWLKMADVELNRISREVLVAGERVDLTGLEFDLLAALIQRPGRVVSRTALLEHAGRADTLVNERAVDVHISHLRKKIGDQDRPLRLIQTVRGVGYVMGRSES